MRKGLTRRGRGGPRGGERGEGGERGKEGGIRREGYMTKTHRQTFVSRLIQRLVIQMRELKVGGVGLTTDGAMKPKLRKGL